MASKSPSYALFLGQQYLARASNDTGLSPTGTFTVSVTFDPYASEAAQNGTIVAKHHGVTAGRKGWVVSYDATTKKAKLTVYDSAGNWKALDTAATITIRANVTFTFNAGTLAAYVNGAASNGTTTNSGTVTAANASVEPFAIGVDSSSSGPTNPFKGAVHFVAFWNAVQSGGNIATMLPNGLLGSGFSLGAGDLVAAWQATAIVATLASDFSAWPDSKSSLALTNTRISGTRDTKVQADTGAVLNTRLWDANLNDQALYSTGLTTTYSLSSPYRLWGASLSEPQISTGFSSTKNDFTLVLKAKKVSGRTSAVLFKKYGINIQFVLSTKELFAIIGDDTTSTLQNTRLSFGLNRFPIDGTDAVFVFRYNAVEKDLDLFINQIGYTGSESSATTNSFETGTGFNLSESCDFISAALTPACLSDAQVDTFVLGVSQLVYSPLGNTSEGSGWLATNYGPDPAVTGADTTPAAVVSVGVLDSVPLSQDARAVYTDLTTLQGQYAANPNTIKDSTPLIDDPTFVDPLPSITSVTLSGGSITASGSAGPTDAYLCRTWWEIELVSNQLQALGASTYPRNLFDARASFSDTFTVPADVNLAGRAAVLVVQPQKNSKQTFRSAPYLIDVVAPTDPVQVITAATIDSTGTCTALVTVSATNAGPCTTWFEVETAVSSGTYARVSGLYTNQNFATGASINTSFALGLPTGWTGRRLRYVINPDGASTVFFYGTTRTLSDFVFASPTMAVTTVTMTAARSVTANGTISATNIGTATTWWELAVTAGVFEAVCAKTAGVDVSAGASVSNTFSVPQNFALTGKTLRLAVQGASGPAYYSSPYTLTETQPTDPNPLVSAASCSTTKLLTANGTIGTCTLPNGKRWWEIDYSGNGQFVAVLGTVATFSMATSSTPSLSYQFPNRFDLTGKSIRLVVQSTDDSRYSWASAPVSITQVAIAAPTVTLSTVTTTALGSFAATGSIGASNAGSVTAWVEVDVAGDGSFTTVIGSQTLTLSAGSPTAFSTTKSLTTGPDLSGKQARLRVQNNTFTDLVYQSSAVAVVSNAASVPDLAVTAATETAAGVLTLTGTAGPTSIGLCDVWFESTVGSAGHFDGRLFYVGSLDLTTQQTVGGSIQLPNRLTLGTHNVTLVATPAGRPDVRYTSAASVISATAYTSPSPAVTAASVSPVGVFTYTGTAQGCNIGAASYWVEVAINGIFTTVIDKKTAPNTAIGQSLSGSVTLPGVQALTSTYARIVYQPTDRADTLYYSATFPITVQTLGPAVSVTSATYTINSGFDCTVQIPGSNNLGAGSEWWEIEVSANVFMAVISKRAVTHSSAAHTTTVTVTLPDRFDLAGKSVRYAFSPAGRPDQVIYSSLFAITVALIADPGPLIQSYSVDAFGQFTGSVRAGPTNAAFCKVWWEVGVENDFTAVLASQTNVNLFSQQVIASSFNLPLYKKGDSRYSYSGKSIRFAVQTNIRPELVYYSAAVSLDAAVPVDPAPAVLSAVAVLDDVHTVSLTGQAGPCNLMSCRYWWEVSFGTFGVLRLAKNDPVDITGQQLLSTATYLPFGLDLQNRELRLVVAPVLDSLLEYRSAPLVLVGPGWANFDVQRTLEVGQDLPAFGVLRAGIANTTRDAVGIVWYEAGTAKAAVVDGLGFFVLPINVTQDMLARTTQNMIDAGDLRFEVRTITNFVDLGAAVMPILNPGGATATTETLFSLWSPQLEATIRYTVNGSVPTSSSPIYDTPFYLGSGTWTIRAIASMPNVADSPLMTATVTVAGAIAIPTITSSASAAAATVGTPWSYQITATNSPTSFGATGLPSWASFNTTTGLISGTPDTAGSLAFSVTATNAGGTSAPLAVSGTVAGNPVPVITSPTTADATLGSAWTYQITATNSPTSYGASGLPTWASLNASSGLISGTPAAATVADASKWLCAFNFEGYRDATATAPNTVTGAPGSTLSRVPVSGLGGLGEAVSAGYNLTDGAASTGQHLNGGSSFAARTMGNFSIGVMCKVTTMDQYGRLALLASNSGVGDAALRWNIHIEPGASPATLSYNGQDVGTTSHVQVDSQWHHYCLTKSGTTVKLYVDGTLAETLTVGSSSPLYSTIALYSVSCEYLADNLFATTETLSASAVAALASGQMPSASGVLTGGSVAPLSFSVTATNAAGTSAARAVTGSVVATETTVGYATLAGYSGSGSQMLGAQPSGTLFNAGTYRFYYVTGTFQNNSWPANQFVAHSWKPPGNHTFGVAFDVFDAVGTAITLDSGMPRADTGASYQYFTSAAAAMAFSSGSYVEFTVAQSFRVQLRVADFHLDFPEAVPLQYELRKQL